MANETATTDDTRSAQAFLLWARSNGFAVQRLTVGTFSADLFDLRTAGEDGAKAPPAPRDVYDALADDFRLPRPSDAENPEDEE